MNVVIVSAVFPPEPVVTAQTSFQIADALFHFGHQVTVLAPFPNRPDGRLFKGYRRSLYRRESMGFSVIRCFSFRRGSQPWAAGCSRILGLRLLFRAPSFLTAA